MIKIEFSTDIKLKIKEFKESLPHNPNRKFGYWFIDNGSIDAQGYKLKDFYIKCNDGHTEIIEQNITF